MDRGLNFALCHSCCYLFMTCSFRRNSVYLGVYMASNSNSGDYSIICYLSRAGKYDIDTEERRNWEKGVG